MLGTSPTKDGQCCAEKVSTSCFASMEAQCPAGMTTLGTLCKNEKVCSRRRPPPALAALPLPPPRTPPGPSHTLRTPIRNLMHHLFKSPPPQIYTTVVQQVEVEEAPAPTGKVRAGAESGKNVDRA